MAGVRQAAGVGAVREGLRDCGVDGDAAQRNVSGVHPLGEGQQIRRDVEMVDGEPLSAAPETRHRLVGDEDNETSRWNAGKDLSFVPLRPEQVVEVRYDHMEGDRFRHTAQFNRWRPDRDPRSCTYAQLEQPLTFSLGDIVPGLRLGDG
jgi:hypothetical protein